MCNLFINPYGTYLIILNTGARAILFMFGSRSRAALDPDVVHFGAGARRREIGGSVEKSETGYKQTHRSHLIAQYDRPYRRCGRGGRRRSGGILFRPVKFRRKTGAENRIIAVFVSGSFTDPFARFCRFVHAVGSQWFACCGIPLAEWWKQGCFYKRLWPKEAI